ncbi:hypothetical protein L6452_22451 [Arctium lappa]|uniref:Uncharacterized protein n=1 Tax=Arctium lappa TaxID=4217 RepID=A0ACB9B066_ARCLA|nr:hypothetical protein L6452_22451 [Arctium lappa]
MNRREEVPGGQATWKTPKGGGKSAEGDVEGDQIFKLEQGESVCVRKSREREREKAKKKIERERERGQKSRKRSERE